MECLNKMYNFKVGDKVKIIGSKYPAFSKYIGEVGVIRNISLHVGKKWIELSHADPNKNLCWNEDELQLVMSDVTDEIKEVTMYVYNGKHFNSREAAEEAMLKTKLIEKVKKATSELYALIYPSKDVNSWMVDFLMTNREKVKKILDF